IVTGAFTLAVIAGVFGFLYWVQNGAGGGGERSVYRVVFAGSVSGLRAGAAVLFDGLRVGEVTQLALDPRHPPRVVCPSPDPGLGAVKALNSFTIIGYPFGRL